MFFWLLMNKISLKKKSFCLNNNKSFVSCRNMFFKDKIKSLTHWLTHSKWNLTMTKSKSKSTFIYTEFFNHVNRAIPSKHRTLEKHFKNFFLLVRTVFLPFKIRFTNLVFAWINYHEILFIKKIVVINQSIYQSVYLQNYMKC